MHYSFVVSNKNIIFVGKRQNNAPMIFYSIIKERRALLGLTQQDLADYSGVSLRIIKSIETGKGNPSVRTLTKIADILGLELLLKVKEVIK